MPLQLAVHCDAHRLFARQIDDARHLVIGINLQFAAEQLGTPSDDLVWLKPWRWYNDPGGWNPYQMIPELDLFFESTGGTVALLAQRPVWQLTTQPTKPTEAMAALDARIDAAFASAGTAALTWDPANPNQPLPVEGHVRPIQAAAARVATAVGYGLNLSAIVKVAKADIPAAVRTASGDLDPTASLWVSPRLNWKGRYAGADLTLNYVPDANGPAGPDRVGWPYVINPLPTPPNAPPITAYVQSVQLEADDRPGRFIQLGTGFVARSVSAMSGGPVTQEVLDPGEDWNGRLLSRIAELWDLPRHMLDAVANYVGIPDFTSYWGTVLAALRDRAGLGLIDTPDGNGLLRLVLQVFYPLEPAAGADTPSTKATLVRDGALRSLLARMRIGEAAAVASLAHWKALLDTSVLSTDVAAELAKRFEELFVTKTKVPQRMVNLSWSPSSPTTAMLLPSPVAALPAMTLRIFDMPAGGTALLPTPPPAELVAAAAHRADDQGAVLMFDAYRQTRPLPAGWYEALPTSKIGDPQESDFVSRRVYVPAGVARDLSVLSRAWAELQDKERLAHLIGPQWNRLAGEPFSVVHGLRSDGWFAEVWTSVGSRPAFDVTSELVGELRPLDGRTWVVTLAKVSQSATAGAAPAWIDGAAYELTFADELQPDGQPTATSWRVDVQSRVDTTAGTLEFSVQHNHNGLPAPQVLGTAAVPLPASPTPYHLRVELGRHSAQSVRVGVYFGRGSEGSVEWNDAAGAADQPIVEGNTTDDASLPLRARPLRLALGVTNPAGATASVLSAISPSLLAARASLQSLTSLADLWYARLDQASSLWQTAWQGTAGHDPLKLSLPKYEIAPKLARGQTARLFAVWHHQLTDQDPPFPQYLDAQLTKLLPAYPAERFDRPAGDKASSVYRDFLPAVAGTAIGDTVWSILGAYLTNVASTAGLLPEAIANPNDYVEQDGDLRPLPVPHALNLQVDTPAAIADTIDGNDDSDFLRSLAGFGVLLRQANKNPTGTDPDGFFAGAPWQLLNCADVGVHSTTSQPGVDPLFEFYPRPASYHALAAPVPLPYQDQTRQVSIAYRNRPLVSKSPLAGATESFQQSDEPAQVPAPFLLQQPSPPTAGAHDSGALPVLKFGQLYQVLPFTVGNCGNMPPLLTGAAGHPAELRSTNIADAELTAQIEPYVRKVKYLRRVGIGRPRLHGVAVTNAAGTMGAAQSITRRSDRRAATDARMGTARAELRGTRRALALRPHHATRRHHIGRQLGACRSPAHGGRSQRRGYRRRVDRVRRRVRAAP